MSRFTGAFARRAKAGSASPQSRSGGTDVSAQRVVVEDYDGLLLLRLPTDDSLDPADINDLSRAMVSHDGTTTIIAAVDRTMADALWTKLREVLDTVRQDGIRSIRLVMAGAGDDRPGRAATARRIAEMWNLTVEAPDGAALVVPGGSVFVPPGTGGWFRFEPGRQPVPLGPRLPSPRWQPALREISAKAVAGCVVDQIPAGLLIRPMDSVPPQPGDVFHAVPVDPRRPAVIVGVPWGEDVAVSDIVELLRPLHAEARASVRLVPGGRSDLLRLAQSLASALDTEVEVTTGLPLFAADGPTGRYGVRSVLFGADQAPQWLPFVDAVICSPAGEDERPQPPQLSRWFTPLGEVGAPPSGDAGSPEGLLPLSPEWHAVVTRAGLWIGGPGSAIPHTGRPVTRDGPVIDIGRAGDRLTSTLWPVLSRLLTTLSPGLRALTTLHVHATTPDGGRALRALAAEHGLRVIRFTRPTPQHSPPPRSPRPPVAVADAGTAGPVVAPPFRGPLPTALPASRATPAVLPPDEVRQHAAGTRKLRPRHLSNPEQRKALRMFAGTAWERHSTAVAQALTALPGLWGQDNEAVHDDLVAVRMYLQQSDELTLPLRTGETRLLPFAACLASGLQWLPPYRGVVLRGANGIDMADSTRPGQLLTDAAPVSGLLLDSLETTVVAGAAYAIWSITGRSVRALQGGGNEIVFVPGTKFRVLDVRTESDNPLILLRQLPDRHTATSESTLEDADDTALARLEQALAGRIDSGPGTWPERCAGPIGPSS
ncbi:hypothetical protein FNH09_05375 [Streptomyces adustus]|uniref:Uncharacterized protein n=1 Tax=Streptomyces adustus TaxID=1609272 RepID=A0A5N8V6F3_9ACTN|nr:hypothetical protein [Streptomyces adustus]MPY30763.1 hypothetical protein [Streptomyces adustus]